MSYPLRDLSYPLILTLHCHSYVPDYVAVAAVKVVVVVAVAAAAAAVVVAELGLGLLVAGV